MTLQEKLIHRGIIGACSEANWQEYKFGGRPGWRYPVYNGKGQPYQRDGETVYRWKNSDSSGEPKYAWIPGKPDKIRYYLLPDTLAAIQQANGVAYLASGEPDVMAYRAAGLRNVFCWFDGENSVPATLAADCELMQIALLLYAPDRDNTGMQSAAKVADLLGEKVRIIKLPGEMGSKHDINWLWQELGMNADKFMLALVDAADVDPVDLVLYREDSAGPKLLETPQTYQRESDELPDAFRRDLIAWVESQPTFKHWGSDGWSSNFCCPFHDDHVASAGFNRDSMTFKCFSECGNKSSKEFGAQLNIHLRDYYEHAPKVSSNGTAAAVETPVPAIIEVPLYRDGYEVALELIAELENRTPSSSEPMAFPFRVFHRYGGFAEILWPGKLVYISGVSGGGKTSLGEVFYEDMLKAGEDIVWFGPEWKPQEMRLRALQRAGGLDMIALGKLRLYWRDQAAGVPEKERRGANVSDGALQNAVDKLKAMAAWPGRPYYLQPHEKLNNLTAILDTIEAIVTSKRAAGRKVRALFFDYLQRAPKSGGARGWDWQEMVVGQIKALCERLDLFGFVFIQPTKQASKNTRQGDTLTEASGQGISDQQCNLYLAITPAFDLKGQKLPYAHVNLVKNSMGRTGALFLRMNWNLLCWKDEEVSISNPHEVIVRDDDGQDIDFMA